ncbi:MAG: helix-turn-helix domain-containing protein [Halanaerobiales bacterium]|nr:helix-turn-helix domain-containing protein [Halanaerobiales bacterium]
MNIGAKIRKLRKKNNFTLKDLSKKTGLSISFISDIENGRRKPRLDNLNKLAEALNLPPDALLSEIKNKIEYNTEVKELLNRYNVFLDGEIITEEDKESVINFLRMLRDRDKKTNKEV